MAAVLVVKKVSLSVEHGTGHVECSQELSHGGRQA